MILYAADKTSMDVERLILGMLHVDTSAGLFNKDAIQAHAAKLDDENLYEVTINVRQVTK